MALDCLQLVRIGMVLVHVQLMIVAWLVHMRATAGASEANGLGKHRIAVRIVDDTEEKYH